MNRGELKSEAKSALKKYAMQLILVGICAIVIVAIVAIATNIVSGILLGITKLAFKRGLVVTIVTSVVTIITIMVSFSIGAVVSVGTVRVCQAAISDEDPGLSQLASILSDGSLGLATKTLIWVYIRTFLWSLLFVIPGIIKGYGYSMVPFILAENPDLGSSEIIDMSSDMMRGHKFELFVLMLSFLGWYFLAAICCGLGFILLVPYVMLTLTVFYNKLKAEYKYR